MATQSIPRINKPQILQQIQSSLDSQGFLDDCYQRYGDIYYSRPVGDVDILTVSHPLDLQQLFSTTHKVADAPGTANQIFKPQVGEYSLILQEGERHQRQRKLMMPPFHGEGMLAYGQQICHITHQFLQALEPGQAFVGRYLTEGITLKIILKVVFGINEGDRFEAINQLVTRWQNVTGSPSGALLLLFPSLQKDWGSWSPWGKYVRLRQQLWDLLLLEIRERRQQREGHGSDMLSLLIAAKYEDGQPMTELELRDNLLTLLNAGHETTATALAWALYWILYKPEIHEKLLAELNAANVSDLVSLSKLPYLTAVCQETLRIYPIVLFTFPRVTTCAVNFRGYEAVEANTAVLPSIYLTHQRADLYPQPKEFRPQRFLERKFSAYEFLPFGGGGAPMHWSGICDV
jgi:cytochrome P450